MPIENLIPNLQDPAFQVFADRVASFDPVTNLTPDDPPFMLAHGAQDNVVPLQQSERFYDLLVAAGRSPEFRMNPFANHVLPAGEYQSAYRFLIRQFMPPTAPPAPATLDISPLNLGQTGTLSICCGTPGDTFVTLLSTESAIDGRGFGTIYVSLPTAIIADVGSIDATGSATVSIPTPQVAQLLDQVVYWQGVIAHFATVSTTNPQVATIRP